VYPFILAVIPGSGKWAGAERSSLTGEYGRRSSARITEEKVLAQATPTGRKLTTQENAGGERKYWNMDEEG
jgi:hypothetical protein